MPDRLLIYDPDSKIYKDILIGLVDRQKGY